MERQAETELARELLAGDAGAFDRFVEHFRTRIFHYSWLMCGHKEDAEEVAQDTLLKVFQNFGQLREPERVRSWIFRIAKNACLMKRRKGVFAPAREFSLEELMPSRNHDGGRMQLEIADWSRLPEDQVLASEMQAVLGRAIRQLPELYRSVILLRDLEELSTQEAAEVLDVTEDVVKMRLHRARLALRKAFDEHLRGAAAGPLSPGE